MCQIREVISIFVPFKGNKRILNGLFYPILRLNSPSEIERVCSGICTPQWDGILQMFAPYKLAQYYSKLNTNSLIKVATEIAKDVTDEFWNLDEGDEFKKAVQDRITDAGSVLKFKISEYLRKQSLRDFPEEYEEEIHILEKLSIDGIITTNWDGFLEKIQFNSSFF